MPTVVATSLSSTAPAPPPTPEATEIVTRPDPGLARGRWEAPAWAFWAILGAVLVGALAYMLRRMGFLARAKPKDSATPPPSRGNKR